MKKSNYLITFSVIFLSCFAGECIRFGAPRASNFDHYWLVQIWPFGYCSNSRLNCTSQLPTTFTIHGLWPVNASGATITTTGPTVNVSDLLKDYPALEKEMNEDWPNLRKDQSNEEFWLYEYSKHGYASPTFKDKPLAYFNTTVDLYKKSQLLNALEAGNITSGSIYPKASYDKALRAKFGQGYNFVYRCIKKGNDSLLSEVVTCVDANAQNFISCTGQIELSKNNCPDEGIELPNKIQK